ncbi:MAG: ABC transporter ATP-binding protein [Deltaproteobacteria bacterium HGW-Deltaproteobacteria-19]|nr:MAG: ABC transporter ATP-binding protein [Deltaproteobacteria bacterium HGW-Deltaproteobacteria-19]
MIFLRNVRLSFGARVLFGGIDWTITERSRIGLVGDNGTGKTTLLRAILGQVELDEGAVDIAGRRDRAVGYLPQDLVELDALPLMDFIKDRTAMGDLERSIRLCEEEISRQATPSAAILEQYENLLTVFRNRGGYGFEARTRQVLRGLGFREGDFGKACSDFSGGWKMRILLSVILLSDPAVMLLDEPTNHLDTESMEWLEGYLGNYPGTLITVSHDRTFLDRMVNQIVELADGKISVFKGGYTFYLAERERRREILEQERLRREGEIRRTWEFVERFRYKATKARQVQSRIKRLERLEVLEDPGAARAVTIRFPEAPRSGREVLTVRDLSKSYGPLEVFRDLRFSVTRGDRVALVGVNGSGKSTLTRILSGDEDPSSGIVELGLNVQIGFFSQESAENLDYERTAWEEVRDAGSRGTDQERRNLLGAFLFSGDDIHKPIRVLSGGEKSRLALLKLILQDTNLLILDEPTNHLDLKTKDLFQDALLQYAGSVIIVSHDRFFLDRMVNRVLEIRDGRLHEYAGNYSYFIEKRALEQAGESEGTGPLAGGTREPPPKEVRRLAAEERNRLSRARTSLKKEFSEVEGRIGTLEADKTAREEMLCDPAVLRNGDRARLLHGELRCIRTDLEKLYERWSDLGQRIEALEATSPASGPADGGPRNP